MRIRHILVGILCSLILVSFVVSIILPLFIAQHFYGDTGSSVLSILYLMVFLSGIFAYAAKIGDV